MRTYFTVEQIKAANKAGGFTFFAPREMRMFRSRVLAGVYGGRYFVTSECAGDRHPRTYTVREVRESGDILPARDGRNFGSADAAKRHARRLAAEDATADNV